MFGRWARVAALALLALGIAVVGAHEEARAQAAGTVTGVVRGDRHASRAGIVAFLENVPGDFPPPTRPVILDQRRMTFVPAVLAILRGTTVRFRNSDVISHNVFSPDVERYDLGTWAPGRARDRRFIRVGIYRQLCRLHPEMGATIVVLQNPYFAVADAGGRFRISGIPPGTYSLATWSGARAPARRSVRVTAGATTTVSLALGRSRQ